MFTGGLDCMQKMPAMNFGKSVLQLLWFVLGMSCLQAAVQFDGLKLFDDWVGYNFGFHVNTFQNILPFIYFHVAVFLLKGVQKMKAKGLTTNPFFACFNA